MTIQQERAVRIKLDSIIREHEGEGSGNGLMMHIADWLRSAPPDERDHIRDVLLDDYRSALPNKIDWIALGALSADGSARVASELEKLARSAAGRLEWRDWLIGELASMGHRPALDLYLAALEAGRDFMGDNCLLRANLIKVDPDLALDHGMRYFVEGFGKPQEEWVQTARCARSFLGVYGDVDPRYVLILARRVLDGSASAGRQLVRAMLQACEFFASPSRAGASVLLTLQKELESLRREIESGLPRERESQNAQRLDET